MAAATPGQHEWQLLPRRLNNRQQLVLATVLAVLVGTAVAAIAMPRAIIAVPVALALAVLALARPYQVFLLVLVMLSLIPVEQSFLGRHIPNWTQLMVPALLLGTVLYNLRHRRRESMRVILPDLLVAGLIIVGLVSIKTQPGAATLKFFVNQQVLPAMAYFIVRWLPLSRERFQRVLRWQLGGAMALCTIMVMRVTTGFDPFYHGFSWLGFGGEAVGPMGSVADTVGYVGIFPALFLYAIATRLSADPARPVSRLWWGGFILSLLATMATTERTGVLAIAAAFGVAVLHRRLFRPVGIVLLILPLLIPVWMFSPVGNRAMTRLHTLKEDGAGFERVIYRHKAIEYMRSPHWNPIVGTGFGRIRTQSAITLPPDGYFYDYNWLAFRPLTEFGERAIHCAPIVLLAEYGIVGVTLILGLLGCIILSLVRARRMATRRGFPFDTALIVATLGAFLGVLANGMFHNINEVMEVVFLVFAFAGLAVGHPGAFIVSEPEHQTNSSGDQR